MEAGMLQRAPMEAPSDHPHGAGAAQPAAGATSAPAPVRTPAQQLLREAVRQLSTVILGKPEAVRLAVCCLIARGHLLIEDVPGVGKTTLAAAIARTLGLELKRIQFTSDLLPSDVIGTTVYDRERAAFAFHQGPLFAPMVLADEINRATPKTQSALLEAMEERQVSVDGLSHQLPEPFFVIATQNPSYQVGTFPLPESQLDRFLMRLHLGFPDRTAERAMLAGPDRRQLIASLPAVLGPESLMQLQQQREAVHVSDPLRDYLLDLVAASRDRSGRGLSPRAGLSLQRAAQAWALMAGRAMVQPEDLQAVAPAVMAHRLSSDQGADGAQIARALLARVPVV
jgi:MoxR-like ATPase